jgi:serine/threonine-protein kinase
MAKLEGGWQSVGLTPAITRSGTLMGTPMYMAPEQVFCERAIDGRADLWALGAILFRALSGRLPIEARTLADLMRRLTAGAVRRFEDEELPAPVPREVHVIIDRLLSVDRDLRPTSSEVVHALRSQA